VTQLFWLTYGILWFVVVLSLLGVVLLYRHLGTMLMAGRRRIELRGLDKGALAPALGLEDRRDEPFILDWRSAKRVPAAGWVVIFANAHCPICKGLWDKGVLLETASLWPEVNFAWIDTEFRSKSVPNGWLVATSRDGSAASMMDVPGFPFGYAIDPSGRIASKVLVNNMADISRLVHEGLKGAGPRSALNSFSTSHASHN
jgi:hypothetical protein